MKIKNIEGLLELHTHNSIPCYTGSEDEGCITCLQNKLLGEKELEVDVERVRAIIDKPPTYPKYSSKRGWDSDSLAQAIAKEFPNLLRMKNE